MIQIQIRSKDASVITSIIIALVCAVLGVEGVVVVVLVSVGLRSARAPRTLRGARTHLGKCMILFSNTVWKNL